MSKTKSLDGVTLQPDLPKTLQVSYALSYQPLSLSKVSAWMVLYIATLNREKSETSKNTYS